MTRLIVVEGLDGSGKKIQTNLLINRLKDNNLNVKHLEFPNYNSRSSELVKMYLQGEISNKAEDINPYLSSIFFAADRGISYIKEWKEIYDNDPNTIFIADRYTTSNMLYQTAKIKDIEEKDRYLNWLWDLEFNKIKIPIPDIVFFLNIDNNTAKNLITNRPNKINNGTTKDIHENNSIFQEKSYKNVEYLVKKYGWINIDCLNENKELKKIDEIHEEIYITTKILMQLYKTNI